MFSARLRDERGGVLVFIALALPMLTGAVAATVEYATLTHPSAASGCR